MIGSESTNPIPVTLTPNWIDHLKAKSADFGGDTLAQHTWQVLARLRDQQRLRPNLPAMLDDPRLWHRAYWACFLHDFGKAAHQFQQRLLPNAQPNEFGEGRHRHEVLSLAFIDWFFPSTHPDRLPVISIVASHHKDANDIFNKYGAGRRTPDTQQRIEFLISQINEETQEQLWKWAVTLAYPWSQEMGFDRVEPIQLNSYASFSSAAIARALDEFSNHCLEAEDRLLKRDEILRDLCYRGLILTADHAASAGSPEYPSLTLTRDQALKPLGQRTLRDHQRAMEQIPQGSSILIAPTGSGKTEAAMLWATKQLTYRPAERLFYTLPYQASMNAMYKRLGERFFEISENQLSTEVNRTLTIQHSRALLKLYQDMMSIDERTHHDARAEAKRLKNLAKLNFYPIQVFSPYQMLKAAYSLKAYETLLLDYTDALFIFDEIHAYEPKRLAMIITLMGWLAREFRARFLIMTATLPPMVKTKLSEALSITAESIVTGSTEEFERAQRHIVHLVEGDLPSQITERLRVDLAAGQSILVCCNRVAVAQRVYRYLKDILGLQPEQDIVLLHGRFNGRDRRRKEQILADKVTTGRNNHHQQPFIVVATQVVEVSLDVDFDVLYTEPAPLEALLQRFGRINRGRREAMLCPVYVFRNPTALGSKPHDAKRDHLPYDQAIVDRSLQVLEQYCGNQAIDESRVTTMLAEIYQGNIAAEWENDYQSSASSFSRDVLGYIQPFRSADQAQVAKFYEMFDGIEVLPIRYVNEYLDAIQEKGYLDASQYLVNISKQQYAEFKPDGLISLASELEQGQYADHIDVNYDEEFGLDLDGARQARRRYIEDED